MAHTLEKEPSNYMQTLTQYLSNIMNTVLLGLPTEIKELVYFLALSHAVSEILVRVAICIDCCLHMLTTFISVITTLTRCKAYQSKWRRSFGQRCPIPYIVRGFFGRPCATTKSRRITTDDSADAGREL